MSWAIMQVYEIYFPISCSPDLKKPGRAFELQQQQAHKPQSYASLKLQPSDRPSDWLTGVMYRATSLAKIGNKAVQ